MTITAPTGVSDLQTLRPKIKRYTRIFRQPTAPPLLLVLLLSVRVNNLCLISYRLTKSINAVWACSCTFHDRYVCCVCVRTCSNILKKFWLRSRTLHINVMRAIYDAPLDVQSIWDTPIAIRYTRFAAACDSPAIPSITQQFRPRRRYRYWFVHTIFGEIRGQLHSVPGSTNLV